MVKRVSHNDLTKAIKELSTAKVEVGFFPTATYTDGKPVAGIAAVHEHGSVTKRIPARPFFRPATLNNQSKHSKVLADATRKAFAGGSLKDGLEILGQVVVGDIKDAIEAVDEPELKQPTIDARARRHSGGLSSDKPLVDTGTLLNSVEYVTDVQ